MVDQAARWLGSVASFGIRRGRASRRIGSHATIVYGGRWQVLLTALGRNTDGGGTPIGHRGLRRSTSCDHPQRRAVNRNVIADTRGWTRSLSEIDSGWRGQAGTFSYGYVPESGTLVV